MFYLLHFYQLIQKQTDATDYTSTSLNAEIDSCNT